MAYQPKNEAYRVRVISRFPNPNGTVVKAWAPTNFQLQVESSWDTPFADVGGGLVGTTLSALGLSLKSKPASLNIWSGSSPITLTLPLEFIAETNARQDVVTPIRQLMSLALPSLESDGIRFIPPGPTAYDLQGTVKGLSGIDIGSGKQRGDRIDIVVGKFLRFENVVIVSVNSDYTLKMSVDGAPMKATAEITFRTFTTLDKEEFSRIFQVS